MQPKDLLVHLEKGDRRLEFLKPASVINPWFNWPAQAGLQQAINQQANNLLFGIGQNSTVLFKELAARSRKLMIAYEHFRFVRMEKIQEFNEALRQKTYNRKDGSYQALEFTLLENWNKVPPEAALTDLEGAINKECFGWFEVAHIVEVKDPIIFGRIEGCTDRFFVTQWDNDVSIDEILKPNEG